MARTFNGSSEYYNGSTGAVSNIVTFTVACWFNSNTITATQGLVTMHSDNGTDGFRLAASGAATGDPIQLNQRANSGNNLLSTTSGYSADTWTHAAAVVRSTTSRSVYKDGGSKATSTTNIAAQPYERTTVGASWTGTEFNLFTSGSLAEAAIWDTDLNDDEILALAKGFRPSLIRPKHLVFYVPMIGEVLDFARGLTLTANGTPDLVDHTKRIA